MDDPENETRYSLYHRLEIIVLQLVSAGNAVFTFYMLVLCFQSRLEHGRVLPARQIFTPEQITTSYVLGGLFLVTFVYFGIVTLRRSRSLRSHGI